MAAGEDLMTEDFQLTPDDQMWPLGELPYRGATEDEQRAHIAFEAQLRHTSKLITQSLTNHAHFTDDCGEYLRAALELSATLASAREEGPDSLLAKIKEYAKPSEDSEAIDEETSLADNFASDGISGELMSFVNSLISRG